jgi:hypothetical protein
MDASFVGGLPPARFGTSQFVGVRTQYTHFVRGACYSRAIDIVGAHPVSETSRSITQ